ncbi:DUF3597 domain-containing protein [Herbaspirillum lusitanum]|uniref:DUF3597 domain-containing protein n=1 Tax=Herbaspirillum lusitanum TaxID=213312 RepID=A0ABW9AEN6_9BURK
MGILGNIFGKIFPSSSTADKTAADASGAAGAGAAVATTSDASAMAAAPAAIEPVDVAAILVAMSQKNSQSLNWRSSIVDLLKLLGLDSSLEARKALAAELHYSGNSADSAAMNIWLHQQVMRKLAENGGKVPDELKG